MNSQTQTHNQTISDQILQIKAYAMDEITEKKSRFIGEIFPVKTENDAIDTIKEVQKKYYDARHHCFAYILSDLTDEAKRSAPPLQRNSDDGEPTGTAGRPILDVLTGANLTDTLIVVTRYFGGTLLGTGGLTRAYTQAAKAAMSAGEIITFRYGRNYRIDIDYALIGNIEHYLREHQIDIGTPRYEIGVSYDLFIPVSYTDQFVNDITNISNGKSVITPGEFSYSP